MFASRAVQHHTREQAPAQTRQTVESPTHGLTPTEPVRGSGPFLQRYLGNSYLQSRATGSETPQKAAVSSVVHDVLRSPGQPLDSTTRTAMESRFSADFSQVRVHTDRQAVTSAQAMHAAAYTVGEDVVLRPEQYRPGTMAGTRLLVHELTHVVQYQRGGDSAWHRLFSDAAEPAEQQADVVATAILHGITPPLQRVNRPGGCISLALETWYRGEALGVGPVPPGGAIHDFGDGLYLTNSVAVAYRYAADRSGGDLSKELILTANFDPKILGRVLDLNTDPRWAGYIKTPYYPGGPTPESLIRSTPGERIAMNKNYSEVFQAFLQKYQVKLEDFDAIVGPEYVRGGTQICIRNPDVQRRVRALMRESRARAVTRSLASRGGVKAGSPPVTPTPGPSGGGPVAEEALPQRGQGRVQPQEDIPHVSVRRVIIGAAVSVGAGALLNFLTEEFRTTMLKDLADLPKPTLDERQADAYLKDPQTANAVRLIDLLAKNFQPMGAQLEEHHLRVMTNVNLELLTLSISGLDFEARSARFSELDAELSAYDDELYTIHENLDAILGLEEQTLATAAQADQLAAMLQAVMSRSDTGLALLQLFTVEELADIHGNLQAFTRNIRAMFQEARELQKRVQKLMAQRDTLAKDIDSIRWTELAAELNKRLALKASSAPYAARVPTSKEPARGASVPPVGSLHPEAVPPQAPTIRDYARAAREDYGPNPQGKALNEMLSHASEYVPSPLDVHNTEVAQAYRKALVEAGMTPEAADSFLRALRGESPGE